jgi:hypothetical protein
MDFSLLHVRFTWRLFEPRLFYNLIILMKFAEFEAPRRVIFCKIFLLYSLSYFQIQSSPFLNNISLRREAVAAVSVKDFVHYAINLLRNVEGRAGLCSKIFSLRREAVAAVSVFIF